MDVLCADGVERASAEERPEVDADLALDVLAGRSLAALALGVSDVAAADLRNVQTLSHGRCDGHLPHESPQLRLGLRARQAIPRSVGPLEANSPHGLAS